jgi:hypothetical protein
MEFVNPWFLTGLSALAIPVIIHLFNFHRYRKVYFTNVRFLKAIKVQTQKQSRLRSIILLIIRLLAIACIVLAFAQPFIPQGKIIQKPGATNAVSIYLDNSLSMQAEGEKGMLIEMAREKIIDILSAYAPTDVFQLMTNDLEGRYQHFVTKEQFRTFLSEVRLSPAVKPISDIIRYQHNLLNSNNSANKTAFLVSDFQRSSFISQAQKDSLIIPTILIPVGSVVKSNVSVDSCWFASPIQQLGINSTLSIRLRNYSENNIENLPVRLIINNIQRGQANVTINPWSAGTVDLVYTPMESGFQEGYIQIDNSPIIFDNQLFISYEVRKTLPVLIVNEEDGQSPVEKLFRSDSGFATTTVGWRAIDYAQFMQNDLIVLNGLASIGKGLTTELLKAVESGRNVVVIPAYNANIADYSAFFSAFGAGMTMIPDTSRTTVNKIVTESPLYFEAFEKIPENADYPIVNFHYRYSPPLSSNAENLVILKGDDPFLTAFPVKKAMVYLLASPLDLKYTNFSNNELFIPTFINMALLSKPQHKLFGTLGIQEHFRQNITDNTSESVLHVKMDNNKTDIIPVMQQQDQQSAIITGNEFSEAGNYKVFDDAEQIGVISLNYDRTESDPYCYPADSLQNVLNKMNYKQVYLLKDNNIPVSAALTELNHGIRFWKLFVFLSLLFLTSEVILLRFWK